MHVELTQEDWRTVALGLQELNQKLDRILSAPRCPKCGSNWKKGRYCGTCGHDHYPDADKRSA